MCKVLDQKRLLKLSGAAKNPSEWPDEAGEEHVWERSYSRERDRIQEFRPGEETTRGTGKKVGLTAGRVTRNHTTQEYRGADKARGRK